MTAPNWERTFVAVVPGLSKSQIQNRVERCIKNESSFAVIDGRLYLSRASLEFLYPQSDTQKKALDAHEDQNRP